MVLNDVERVQKRELIRGNRERRELETLLTLVRPPLSSPNPRSARAIDDLTKAYCQHVDVPLEVCVQERRRRTSQCADFDVVDVDGALEQRLHNDLSRAVLARIHNFAQNVDVYNAVLPFSLGRLFADVGVGAEEFDRVRRLRGAAAILPLPLRR